MSAEAVSQPHVRRPPTLGEVLRRHPQVAIGATLLLILVAIALLAPWIADADPRKLNPGARLRPPSAQRMAIRRPNKRASMIARKVRVVP